MIHVAFEGGLGNQLFQYAYARYAQLEIGDNVIYDKSKYYFEKIEFRDFQIEQFNIPDSWKSATIQKNRLKRFGIRYFVYLFFTMCYLGFNKITKNKELTLFDSSYQKAINFWGYYRCHSEKYIDFKDSLWSDKYIRGHWFTSKYANKIRDVLIKDLTYDKKYIAMHDSIINQITSTNSVAVHIRRGDYVKLGMIVCNLDYYLNCINIMAKKVNQPVFYIFSDDIEWVKSKLVLNYPVIYLDEHDAFTDMMIMSFCKFFIISNSTFSWWGSWLGSDKNKIVMAPDYWINKRTIDTDLYCENWILMPTEF